jgi:hypothetical protein
MTEPTYVFVGGLHRSGTTLLARLLAEHPDVSGLHDTGVREDEGQHLQHTYAPAREFGGAGRFAFDPRAHLVEVDADTARRHREELLAAWNPHWNLSRRVLVEKSPPNLIRMRYLQSVFPDARFVLIVRHPITTTLATKKWRRRQSLFSLIRHWIVAHDIATADAKHVDHFLLVRYEDLVRDPATTLDAVQRFVGVTPQAPPADAINASASDAYAKKWRATNGLYRRALVQRFGDDFARYGYDADALE